jgi:hypothetical protein
MYTLYKYFCFQESNAGSSKKIDEYLTLTNKINFSYIAHQVMSIVILITTLCLASCTLSGLILMWGYIRDKINEMTEMMATHHYAIVRKLDDIEKCLTKTNVMQPNSYMVQPFNS